MMPNSSKVQAALAQLIRQAVLNAIATAWLLLACAVMLTQAMGLSSGFSVKALLLFTLAVIWLGFSLPEHLPLARIGPANQVTLGRLALTALLAGLIHESPPAIAWLAFGIACLVLALDGVDGWLARRSGCTSKFGARFDMETDALLILLMAVLTWQLEQAGVWVLLSGAMRYLFVTAALIQPWLRRPLQPSRRRKLICVLQIMSLLLALLPFIEPPWSSGLALVGLVLLCYSFATDIVWLWRQAGHPPEEPIVDEHP
jgi:phosphatidylglycerophosphate synthase